MRVGALVLLEIGAAAFYQRLRIPEPAARHRVFFAYSRGHHGTDDQIPDADRRLSGAVEKNLLIRQFGSRNPLCCVQPRQGDARCALNVVVEHTDALSIFLEEPKCIHVGEVLEL